MTMLIVGAIVALFCMWLMWDTERRDDWPLFFVAAIGWTGGIFLVCVAILEGV